ncbi:hypothetical protein BD311DRAFT_679728 [Dichomitus squalens]|uniref:Uncharacterized protein n=1 Tax=Dichomitus squalens TaxID=114155 RepID=A0A4Q9N619_9APHY|nr:hypothetical protein BD311DRAFT_679728 [Dichomitus squalens]
MDTRRPSRDTAGASCPQARRTAPPAPSLFYPSNVTPAARSISLCPPPKPQTARDRALETDPGHYRFRTRHHKGSMRYSTRIRHGTRPLLRAQTLMA